LVLRALELRLERIEGCCGRC